MPESELPRPSQNQADSYKMLRRLLPIYDAAFVGHGNKFKRNTLRELGNLQEKTGLTICSHCFFFYYL